MSESQRKAYAARGLKHAQKFHAEKPVLERLAKVYRAAIDKMAARPVELPPEEEFPYKPGTFRTSKRRAVVSVKNQAYTLREGIDVVIPAPGHAQAMRRIARYKPEHGISEVA